MITEAEYLESPQRAAKRFRSAMNRLWWLVPLVVCIVACESPINAPSQPADTAGATDVVAMGPGSDLSTKWDAPLIVAAVAQDVCEQALKTVQKNSSGEIDGFDALGEILAGEARLSAANTILADWAPNPNQTDLFASLQSQMAAIRDILTQWSAGDVAAVHTSQLLESQLGLLKDTLQICIERAKADGLSDESIQAVLEHRADSIRAYLQTDLPPSICDCGSVEETQ